MVPHTGIMQKTVRFLILRGGAIGDFIATLPAIQALRDQWPDAYIEVLGYPHIANLALAAGLVDHVDSLDRAEAARFFSRIPEFSDRQREHIRSFDLVISYLHDRDGLVRHNILSLGAKQVIYGSPLVEEGHAVDHLLKPLETLAIYAAGSRPKLELSEPLRGQGRAWLVAHGAEKEPVALHPGSGSPKKNWPAERFAELAGRLAAAGRSPVFILGEADAAEGELLRAKQPGVPVLSDASLVEVASVLSACRGYVGNDSGITHLAAALGLPVVALFGPSDAARWAPRGERARTLEAPGGDLSKIAVENVLEALGEMMGNG